ncbi:MAG: PEP-utilizing enzyme [Myxococcota bacterium]
MDAPDLDPLHRTSGPRTAWTRVNIAEGIPGVSTPLNWSWWDDANERMIRGAYHDLGVLASPALADPRKVDERTSAIFYGRPALNLDVSRRLADLQPGTSGEALERHYFGAVRPDAVSTPSRRRYPVIALRLPGQWRRVTGRVRASYEETHAFWRRATAPDALAEVEAARRLLAEARPRFDAIARPHSVLALLCGALMQQVGAVAEAAGRPEAVLDALGGYDSVELETLTELIEVRRGTRTLDDFLRLRGYQGPQQGELSSVSWREDPAPVRALVESLDPGRSEIASLAADRAAKRARAEAAIRAGLSGWRAHWGDWLFREAARMLPERESGKAAMMLCLDAARAAVRRIGAELAGRGVLADPEDVFYLVFEELDGPLPDDVRALVAARRKQRDEYLALELPESWVGMVTPRPIEAVEDDAPLAGLGVSPGVVEGDVRVVADGAGELLPGEILVCTATDPSYAGYFLVAAGVVTEIGGAMGHGAIVAREVGIPCVVNAKHATRRLRTGDRIRIDGATGAIGILSRGGSR